jgi:hypothetical protein
MTILMTWLLYFVFGAVAPPTRLVKDEYGSDIGMEGASSQHGMLRLVIVVM